MKWVMKHSFLLFILGFLTGMGLLIYAVSLGWEAYMAYTAHNPDQQLEIHANVTAIVGIVILGITLIGGLARVVHWTYTEFRHGTHTQPKIVMPSWRYLLSWEGLKWMLTPHLMPEDSDKPDEHKKPPDKDSSIERS